MFMHVVSNRVQSQGRKRVARRQEAPERCEGIAMRSKELGQEAFLRDGLVIEQISADIALHVENRFDENMVTLFGIKDECDW